MQAALMYGGEKFCVVLARNQVSIPLCWSLHLFKSSSIVPTDCASLQTIYRYLKVLCTELS